MRHRGPARRLLTFLVIACGAAGCRIVEPIVASDSYTVQDDGAGKTEIEVRIDGGDGVSRLRQRDLIKDFMLDLSRDPSRESSAFDAMLELESLFELNGFPSVRVEYRIERDKGTRVVFKITQHRQVILDSIHVVGGPEKEEDLLEYLPRRKSEVLGLGDDLYVAADLDTLRRGIVTHYRRLGYLDAEAAIDGPHPPISQDPERVAVRIQVAAKQRYRTGAVTITEELLALFAEHGRQLADWRRRGADPDTRPGPDEPRRLRSGVPYIARDVQDYALAVTRYLRSWGHPEPEILSSVRPGKPDAAGRPTVDVSVHGSPGTKAVVRAIEIEKVAREDGSSGFVSVDKIRERISLEVGKRFDGDLEEKSLMRLYRSGLFRGVETEYRPAGPGEIIVVFKVRDTTRYLVQPMVGAGSYERIRGGLEFEMLGLFGTDFDFNTKAIVSDKGHRISASISDSEFWPELFGLDTTLTFAADDFRRVEPSYTDGATGFSPSISKLFSQEWSTRVGYNIRDHGNVFSSVVDPGAQIGDYREGSVVVEVAYDSRKNPVMPKDGSRVALQHKWADSSLGGEVSFHRTRFSASRIFPITENSRFVVRGEVGLLWPQDGMDAVPIQERFFNGGDTTVRSFREDQLAPASLRDVNGKVIGGGFRNVANLEYRWSPPWQPLRAVEWEFAVFGDAGNLGRTADDYDAQNARYAVGAGVRFLLPIGPVRFDYARNPDRDPGERDWVFHFSIGHAF